jgi:formamidopyrimidine-DNA glycosylase
MPELPEVEHARGQLQRWLRSATIQGVVLLDARILDTKVTPRSVKLALEGRRVRGVDRRGKWLRLRLDEGVLFSHLGMTGKWVATSEDQPAPRFAKVAFTAVRRGVRRRVTYVDPRLFGRFVVASADIGAWSELGPDPIHDGIDVARLHARLAKRKGPIKPALLDQRLLAGVGNIQATEGLFFARIDPRRACDALERREVSAIARGVLRSIRATMEDQAADEGLRYLGEGRDVENPFHVYGRRGEPCPRCSAPLQSIVQAARTTTFCAACQR